MSLAPTIGKAGACLLGLTATAALVLMPEPAPAADPSPGQACAPAPFFDLADNERALGDELEILSWNVQKSSNTGWAEDMALLGNATDLAFIQEASTVSGISNLIPRLLHRAFSRGYTTDTMETGVMTLSSGLPDMHCSLTAMEPWLGTPKATSVTSYALKDRSDRLLAINLHAVNFAFGLDEFGQQFADLRHLLDAHEGPVILAGDLNTWSDKRQSLVDRFASEFDLQPVSFEPDLRTTVFGRALDHVYVRGLRTLSAEVIPVDTSDHNPLRVRLGLR
jgi:endonuclease/exonuclease/phosphatase (EEP) superfamily protein YafD